MYLVNLSRKAKKGYDTYSVYRKQIDAVLEALETSPYPFHNFDLAKLKGLDGAYRIRIGKMRVKYHVLENETVILIYYIGPRETAYD